MRGTVPSRTILSKGAEEGLPASHPLFYTQERSKYLQRLSAQTQVQSQLPTNDLRRNMRIDHYLNQYNQIQSQIQKQARIKNSMLKTNQFDSLFANQEGDRRGKQREVKKMRNIQDELFNNYVQNPQIYRPAEKDIQMIEGPQTVLQMGGNRMKELYLLDLEMDRLKRQENLDKEVKYKHESCQNNKLLGKLSSTLMSSYLVHFDQIIGLMVDELLEQEVIYLNHLEAEYKIGSSQHQIPTRKTVQMAELVRALDDLCDR